MDDCCWRSWVKKTLKTVRRDTESIRASLELNNTRFALLEHANQVRHEAVMAKLTELGVKMSEVTDALADLNDATNEVAGELETAAAKIQELTDQLANTDPEAAAKVAEALTGISSAATRLRGLAEDPENPVPPVEEPPVDNGGGDNIPPLG